VRASFSDLYVVPGLIRHLRAFNRLIRADDKNDYRLRTRMHPSDIAVVRGAGQGGDGHAIWDLRKKIAKESISRSMFALT
jgi:hypothetical protein